MCPARRQRGEKGIGLLDKKVTVAKQQRVPVLEHDDYDFYSWCYCYCLC